MEKSYFTIGRGPVEDLDSTGSPRWLHAAAAGGDVCKETERKKKEKKISSRQSDSNFVFSMFQHCNLKDNFATCALIKLVFA